MNKSESDLIPGFRRSHVASIKGDRTRHVVTMNPNSVKPEDLYIDVPKLTSSSCLVPGSLHLVYDFKVEGAKSHFKNNLSKLLHKKIVVSLSGESVYENNLESVYSIYKDLWKTNSERNNMIEYGIANQNLRKLISGDDTGAKTGDIQKVSDELAYNLQKKAKNVC